MRGKGPAAGGKRPRPHPSVEPPGCWLPTVAARTNGLALAGARHEAVLGGWAGFCCGREVQGCCKTHTEGVVLYMNSLRLFTSEDFMRFCFT